MASSLETVLAALSRSSLERENGASSFILLQPVWNAGEIQGGMSTASDLSLQRIGFSGEDLDLKTRKEEELIQAFRNSSRDTGLKLLQAHLQTLRNRRNRFDASLASAITDSEIKENKLGESLRNKSQGLSRKLVNEILRWSVKLKVWDPVYALIEAGGVSANEYPELIDEIVELENVPLVCLCVLRVPDIRPSQWQQILNLFLAHPASTRDYFRSMRNIWKNFVTSFMERTAEDVKKPGAQNVAMQKAGCLKLAAAFDSFSAHELCLHLFVAGNQDEAVLGAIFGELESPEVLMLLRYLNKWLEKYSSSLFYVEEVKRKLVPSLAQVLCCVGALLEGRYTSLALDQSVSQELGITRGLVNSLVTSGRRTGALEGIVQHLSLKKALPSDRLGLEAEHIIEYMQFN